MQNKNLKMAIGTIFFLIALIFVYRSFYNMRIPEENTGTEDRAILPHDTHGINNLPPDHPERTGGRGVVASKRG
jgi:hypothetical protein